MYNIINHTPHSLESFSFEALTQCITTIHSTLQTSAVNAVNRFATIRNWLIGRYIVEYEQCGNDRAQYGVKLLPNIVARVKIKGINATLLANARNFYLEYPQMNEVVAPIFPMLSKKLKDHPLPLGLSLISSDTIFPTPSDKFTTPAKTLLQISRSPILSNFLQ